ncbi:MAG TPA: ABC transporter permease, partial [Gemmatimonadales bacterium]|nr:ABC transporter permease [Gemmatimonadales bacterium]
MSPHRPPRLTAWILSRLLPETERDAILGDLEEEFRARIVQQRGLRDARRWYRIQALRALRMTSSPTASHELPPARLFAMGDLIHELRFAFRQLRHRPLYAGITIFTLAMGIGASGAVLSVANPVLFRSLPYPDADRIVTIWEIENEGGQSNLGYPTIMDLKAGARTFEAVAAIGGWGPVLTGATESESLTGQSVSADFFKVLGVKPALGRDFKPAEDAQGQNGVVILGHRLWQRQFHGDPGILESTIKLGIREYRVVGVLPASFESLLNSTAEIWRPLGYDETMPQGCRTCRHLRMVVRLKPGATLEQAQSE